MDTVCRTEIADCLQDAFVGPPLSAAELVDFAAGHDARPSLLEVLGRLHGPGYRELRELWIELADVPVEP